VFAVNLKMVSTIQTAKFYVNLAVVTAKFCINLAVEEGKMRTFEFSLYTSSKATSQAISARIPLLSNRRHQRRSSHRDETFPRTCSAFQYFSSF
jgi:hypothetical protein